MVMMIGQGITSQSEAEYGGSFRRRPRKKNRVPDSERSQDGDRTSSTRNTKNTVKRSIFKYFTRVN